MPKNLFDASAPENTTIADTDRLASWKQSDSSKVYYLTISRLKDWVRTLFTAGSNVSIDANGVISSNATGTANVTGGNIIVCNTIADMKALTGVANNASIDVLGYLSANDGGGGEFYYLSASTATADNGHVIAPNSGTGRFFRKVDSAKTTNVLYFGAKANDFSFNNIPAFNAARDYAIANGIDLIIPPGIWRITSQWLWGVVYTSESDGLTELYAGDAARVINSTNLAAAKALTAGKKRPSIIGSGNCVIYGDFTPSVFTAMLHYALPGDSLEPGAGTASEIKGIVFAAKSAYSGGNLVQYGDVTAWLCGLYLPAVTNIKVSSCAFRSLHLGIFGYNNYQNSWSDILAWKCGIGIQSWGCDGSAWTDTITWYSDTGYRLSAKGFTGRAINSQNCSQDFYGGDIINSVLNSCYIESPNSTEYGVIAGLKSNSVGFSSSTWVGFYPGGRNGAAHNKAVLINNSTNLTLIGCKAYGVGIDIAAGKAPKIIQIGSDAFFTGAGSSANCVNLTP